jgi:hypothetical protein
MFEWQIEYQPVENHLLLKSKGTMDVQSANVMVKELAEAAEKHQCVKHLIDHRETTFAFSFVDYYERPAVNARLGISRLFITAMVFSKITEDTKFMETVFRNRGFSMYHFIDMDQAREWLKQR